MTAINPRRRYAAGQRFGKLVLVRIARRTSYKDTVWLCQCDCGGTAEMMRNNLRRTGHCGCLTAAHRSLAKGTHHKSGLPEYGVWKAMISRCGNPKDRGFKNYGGRGITVCERWRHSVQSFLEDMGERPSKKHSIDRVDNDGPYCKENCRWATKIEQCNNMRKNVLIEWRGQTMTVSEWSRVTGIPRNAIRKRHNRGWSQEKMLASPSDRSNQPNKKGAL